MPGGLIQIVAYGHQDVYLTTNPQITFFKVVYRRYTNFSMETFERTISDNPDFGKFENIKLYRLGDLMTNMHLKITLGAFDIPEGAKACYVRRLGHSIIKKISIEIGGVKIDTHYGIWLDIWNELTLTGKKEDGMSKMLGDVPELTAYNSNSKPEYTLFIPLRFWFNRHIGLAFPYIATQYHEVYIKLNLEDKEKLIVRNSLFTNFADIKILDASLLINFIYLDTEERKKFAYVGHEYLIEQVQTIDELTLNNFEKKVPLNFNHPTKELIWVLKNGLYTSGKTFLCYTHEDDWSAEILRCSEKLLSESTVVLRGPIYRELDYGNREIIIPGIPPPEGGNWEEFEPGLTNELSQNGNISVTNLSRVNSLHINFASLKINDQNLLDKIKAIVTLFPDNRVQIEVTESNITPKDISIPIENYIDTRITRDDIIVYQHTNYGEYIDYSVNPLRFCSFEWNDQIRVQKRNGKFFGTLQPYLHHSKTPRKGINLYSFSIEPELHQPTGTSNLSIIEREIVNFYFDKNSNIYDENTRLYIFGFSYNILRFISGLVGLAYTG